MSDHRAAELAAKALAAKLNIPSWQGSVSVWHDQPEYTLRVFVNRAWMDRSSKQIPTEFQGFKVFVDDKLQGTAHKFRMSNYA